MSRKLRILLIVLVLLFLGFLKEYVFVGINMVLFSKYYSAPVEDGEPIRPAFMFLTAFSYNTIYTLKWLITPAFIGLFWFLQKKLLTIIFAEKKTSYWLGVMYLSLLLLAGISFFTGWAIGYIHEGYRFSRIFVGLAESPVPGMILIPLVYFYKNYNTEL